MTILEQIKVFADLEADSGYKGVIAIWFDWRDFRDCAWSFTEELVDSDGGRDGVAARLNADWGAEGVHTLVLRHSETHFDVCAAIHNALHKSGDLMAVVGRSYRERSRPVCLLILGTVPFPADGASPDYEFVLDGERIRLKVVDHARFTVAQLALLNNSDTQLQGQIGLLQYYLRRRWPVDASARQCVERLFSALGLAASTSRMLAGLPKGKGDLTPDERNAVIEKLRLACTSPPSPAPIRIDGTGLDVVNWIAHAPTEHGIRLSKALREVYGSPCQLRSTTSSLSTLLLVDVQKSDRVELQSTGAAWAAHQAVLLLCSTRRWGNIIAHKDDYAIRLPMPHLVGVLRHEVEHAREVVSCWKP